jgi:OOP family OmpA-OmpF porin
MHKITIAGVSQFAAIALGAVAVSPAGAQVSPAQEQEDSGYINVLPFYLSADANRRGTTDDGRGMMVGYGHPISPRWSWEFQSFADSISISQGNLKDFNQYGMGVDFRFDFSRNEGATPFLLLGTGVVRNDVFPDAAKANDVFGTAGFGFVTGGLGKSEIRLRGEVRYLLDRYESGFEGNKNDRRVSLGVQIPLGRRTVERIVEREVEVERVIREPVPAAIVDSDNDGVPNQNDQCPGTLEGLATDNRGCASTRPQAVRLDEVNFEFNSAILTPSASDTLRRVAEALRGEPSLRAEIAGHTDSSGADAYNLSLSQQRADSVLQFLVGQGIDRNRLVARGYGETQPEADNSTAEGQRRNRRVEFEVLN